MVELKAFCKISFMQCRRWKVTQPHEHDMMTKKVFKLWICHASTGTRNIKNSPAWNKGFMWENPCFRLKHIVKEENLGKFSFFYIDEKYS